MMMTVQTGDGTIGKDNALSVFFLDIACIHAIGIGRCLHDIRVICRGRNRTETQQGQKKAENTLGQTEGETAPLPYLAFCLYGTNLENLTDLPVFLGIVNSIE